MTGQVFEILDGGGAVINRIVACPAFVEQAYPGRWRLAAAPLDPAAPPAVPGDDCASARVRVGDWLKGRAR
nr:MAG TPA: hypothetical protein [Caudoviricetes sp.]